MPGLAPSTRPRMLPQRRSQPGATARSPSSAPTSKQSCARTGGRTLFPEHPSRFTWNAGPEPPPSQPPAGATVPESCGLSTVSTGRQRRCATSSATSRPVPGTTPRFETRWSSSGDGSAASPPLRNCAPSSTAGYPPPDTTQPLGEVRVEPSHPVDSQPVWNGERTRTSPHIARAIPIVGDRNRWRHRRVGSATSMACSVRPGRQCAPHTLRGPP